MNKKDLDAVTSQWLALADRRELVCKTAPKCPECGTKQVQLIHYFEVIIGWKCRWCGERFETSFNDHKTK